MLDIIPWLLWLIGIAGVGGTIALFVFAPALAGVLLRGLLSFLMTPLGAALAAGAVCFAVGLGYGNSRGRAVELAKCQAQQAQADREAKQRDEEQGRAADADAQQRLDELDAQHKRDQEIIDGFRRAARDPAACILTPEDLGAPKPKYRVIGPPRYHK